MFTSRAYKKEYDEDVWMKVLKNDLEKNKVKQVVDHGTDLLTITMSNGNVFTISISSANIN